MIRAGPAFTYLIFKVNSADAWQCQALDSKWKSNGRPNFLTKKGVVNCHTLIQLIQF